MPVIHEISSGQLRSIQKLCKVEIKSAEQAIKELSEKTKAIRSLLTTISPLDAFLNGVKTLEERFKRTQNNYDAFRTVNLELLTERLKVHYDKYVEILSFSNEVAAQAELKKAQQKIEEWERLLQDEEREDELLNDPEAWKKKSGGQITDKPGKIESKLNYKKTVDYDTAFIDLPLDYYERLFRLSVALTDQYRNISHFYNSLSDIINEALKNSELDISYFNNFPLLKKYDLDDIIAQITIFSSDRKQANIEKSILKLKIEDFGEAISKLVVDTSKNQNFDHLDFNNLEKYIIAAEEKLSGLKALSSILTQKSGPEPLSPVEPNTKKLLEAVNLLTQIESYRSQYEEKILKLEEYKGKIKQHIETNFSANTKNEKLNILNIIHKIYENILKRYELILTSIDNFKKLIEKNSTVEDPTVEISILQKFIAFQYLAEKFKQFEDILASKHQTIPEQLDTLALNIVDNSNALYLHLPSDLFYVKTIETKEIIYATPTLLSFLKHLKVVNDKLNKTIDSFNAREENGINRISMAPQLSPIEPPTPIHAFRICSVTEEQVLLIAKRAEEEAKRSSFANDERFSRFSCFFEEDTSSPRSNSTILQPKVPSKKPATLRGFPVTPTAENSSPSSLRTATTLRAATLAPPPASRPSFFDLFKKPTDRNGADRTQFPPDLTHELAQKISASPNTAKEEVSGANTSLRRRNAYTVAVKPPKERTNPYLK